jgi:hypothetical protein
MVALAAHTLLCASGCLLVGYQEKSSDVGAGFVDADAATPVVSDAARDGTTQVDADQADAAHRDGSQPHDGATDAATLDVEAPVENEDAGFDCARDGGCACPPNGSVCAGDLWLTCNAQGQLASTINCRETLSNGCHDGTCTPLVGCTTEPSPDGSPCDDGKFCTAVDLCAAGVCGGRGSPCADNVCLAQTCNETSDACTLDAVYSGKACGTGLLCSATGVCKSSSNCTGVCTPECVGQATCGFDCHDAQSCTTSCVDGQTCDVDCAKTATCDTTCDGYYSNCNMDCAQASSCTATCNDGDCALGCKDTQSCKNSCEGHYSVCKTSCSGSLDCATNCDGGARCTVSDCTSGHCNTVCHDESRCDVNCNGATSCTTSCELDSTCAIDCRNAETCGVYCSLYSQCYLRCAPGQPDCRFTHCYGGATRCADGSLVCHMDCPL